MNEDCQHPSFHGPTPEGNWICNKCGDEVVVSRVDNVIPLPGTEKCEAAVNIHGAHYPCELAPPHDGWAHSNKAAQAIWK